VQPRRDVLGHHAGRELIWVERLVHGFLGQERHEIVWHRHGNSRCLIGVSAPRLA
jgi:hypothetical protein